MKKILCLPLSLIHISAVKENMRKKAEAEKSQGKTPVAHQGCPGDGYKRQELMW